MLTEFNKNDNKILNDHNQVDLNSMELQNTIKTDFKVGYGAFNDEHSQSKY